VRILNCVDIYCHVGRVDIEPVSALEAISVGIAPILTDSPVSAVSGFALSEHNLYHHGSPKSLAEAIDYWIEHPEERKKNAEAYAGFADRFGFEKSMNQMEAMWQEVIANYSSKK
ncbi:MAG: glycosyltransferase, partial [Bacilli bacterium]|nr:glycosyltransferase [Bacilli bacterium]